MTSEKKIAANRKNAKFSTGPRTARGKRKSRLNARRHGLAVAIDLTEEVQQLAGLIVGAVETHLRTPELNNLALRIAETEIEIQRAKSAKLEVYKAVSVSNDLANGFGGLGVSGDANQLSQPGYRFALTAVRKIDRYERRALSRQTKAVRAYHVQLWRSEKRKQGQDV